MGVAARRTTLPATRTGLGNEKLANVEWTRNSRQTLTTLLGQGVVVMSETGIGVGSGGGWESICGEGQKERSGGNFSPFSSFFDLSGKCCHCD